MSRAFTLFAVFVAILCHVSPIAAQDSLNVRRAGQCSMSGWTQGVAVAGNYAYVASWDSSLHVIDVSNPATPGEVGCCNLPDKAYDVAVAGNYAYVADMYAGLRVIDISSPIAPFEVGFYDTPNAAIGVTVEGNFAYVADNGSGVRIINISNPTAPIEIGFYDTPGHARDVVLSGNFAYVADDEWYVWVLNISDPTAPTLAYQLPGAGHVLRSVAVTGTRVYTADIDNNRFYVWDISDTSRLHIHNSLVLPGPPYAIIVAGHYAYVADYHRGLRVLSICNPSLTEVGYYDTPGWARDVAVSGDYAYVADQTYLGIYDISYFEPYPAPPLTPDSLVIQYLPILNQVQLHWSPVIRDSCEALLTTDRYIVYRGACIDSSLDSLGIPIPQDTTVFIDSTAVEMGERFFYQVKAVSD